MDYYTILAQRTFLSSELTGSRIETVRIKDKYNLFIGFAGDRAVKLSSVPDMPYLLTIEKKFIPKKNAHPWYQNRFSERTLTGLSMTHGDRILTFHCDTGVRLIFEMTGRHANIIIVDSDGTIVGALRKVTKRESTIREINPGVPYMPPPVREFPDLVWGPLPVLERLLKSANATVLEAVQHKLCSGSRYFAHEALSLAGIDHSAYTVDLHSDDIFRLLEITSTLSSKIEHGGNGATIIYRKDGLPQDVFPVKMTTDSMTVEHIDDLNEAVRKYSREREVELERRSLRNAIMGALNREERQLRSTIGKVERERGDKSEPENLERLGNTVLANLNSITKGMTSVTLTDPYGSGEIEVELDAALDGPANAGRFFKRAKKLRSASRLAEERLSSLRNRLEKVITELNSVKNLDALEELRKISTKYVKTKASARDADIEEKFPRRYKSVSGLDIIVGRNDRENDELVRWARKNDLWLHAQNIGGSHVILRTPGKQPPDRKSIEQSASIAAYYSKAKNSAIVPVACTQVKYVVKRRGQGPGKVTYTREKVIFAQPGVPGFQS